MTKYRRRKKLTKQDERVLLLIIIVATFIMSLYMFPALRIIIGVIAGLVILVLGIKYWRTLQRRTNAEPYYVQSQCPHCGHQWNRVRYLKGDKPRGALVICDRCGNKYRHSRL